ncbi:methyltransferase [Emticicia aquatilis]|uniref:Methyltransferase n=1 Tax=Emticicia aquatilis TaxID=1537369 RepID=A0A917DV63_9BACT|nr:site-specific DNA-methyltransferase [Emticicia aquatilis]GGD69687.1 methyltransferase [Emticicia aquatilis]
MQTKHEIHFGLAQQMHQVQDNSIDLVVTSPPYPMIEMWDEIMSKQNPAIAEAIKNQDGKIAFELMHIELDKVWEEVNRVTKNGSFVCINIGDATRTINGEFQLFSNHSRIIQFFLKKNFSCLPAIIWRKPTNSPNKFMGSGMLAAGAYVTLEHEHILIFRKGGKRVFKTEKEKKNRQESAFFWEERNQWFSDLWEIRGTNQKMNTSNTRERSGAYPFEIPYRLINMYSAKGDTILDPFIGTGTTTLASMMLNRNSIGFEIDENLSDTIYNNLYTDKINLINDFIRERLKSHIDFVEKRMLSNDTDFKHFNEHYKFPVMTSQETNLLLNFLTDIQQTDNQILTTYSTTPEMSFGYVQNTSIIKGQQTLAF